MPNPKPAHEPVRQSVHVDCPVEEAFRLFTENFSEWWPLARYSVHPEEAETCVLEPWPGGRIFERTRSGEEIDWGSVAESDAPHRLTFDWHPGRTSATPETVELDFRVEADGTRITVTHHHWEVSGIAVSAVLENSFTRFVAERMLVFA